MQTSLKANHMEQKLKLISDNLKMHIISYNRRSYLVLKSCETIQEYSDYNSPISRYGVNCNLDFCS